MISQHFPLQIFLLIWEDENCGPERENFLPGFPSSPFSLLCQTVENTVFHPIFLPMFSIISIFTPTKHSARELVSNYRFLDKIVMFSLNNHLLLLFYYLTYPPTHHLLPTTHNIHHTTSLFLSIFLIFQNNTFSSSWPNFLLSNSNTVFGWGENKKDGKYRVENTSVFHCLAKEEK